MDIFIHIVKLFGFTVNSKFQTQLFSLAAAYLLTIIFIEYNGNEVETSCSISLNNDKTIIYHPALFYPLL